MKKIWTIAATAGVVGIAVAAGVFGTDGLLGALESRSDAGEDEGGRSATRVTVAVPESATIRDSFDAVGTILPIRSVDLMPLAEGRVTEIAVASGDIVKQGDLLFALDDRTERATLNEAQATLAEAEGEFRRYEELLGENTTSEARFEEARGGFLRAEAVVEAAQVELDDRRLVAPFGGILGLVDLDPGERVDTATTITTLDDLSQVQVEFAVPERYYGAAEIGQDVTLTSAIFPGRSFEGEVSVIAPRVDPNSRSFRVRAMIANEDRALVGGMFMNVSLTFGTYDALTIPDDAIISEGSATYVYVVAENEARRTAVSLGQRQDGRTEIADGLSAEHEIVTTGYDTLSDGDAVTIGDEGAPEESIN